MENSVIICFEDFQEKKRESLIKTFIIEDVGILDEIYTKKYSEKLFYRIQWLIETKNIEINFFSESLVMCMIFLKYFCYKKLTYVNKIKTHDILKLAEFFDKFSEIKNDENQERKKFLRKKIDIILYKLYYVETFYYKIWDIVCVGDIIKCEELPDLLFLIKRNYFQNQIKKEILFLVLNICTINNLPFEINKMVDFFLFKI